MPAYSALERQVLQAIIAHVSQNEEISLTELADECHVSKSTVVRAVQKMGYRGFSDLTRSVRLSAQTSADALLPRAVTIGSLDAEAKALACALTRCRGKRNLMFSGDRRLGALLAAYMSRKLAMFDIFAPASYDYAMTAQGALPVGVAFFCFHNELPGRRHLGQQEGYGEGMLRAAHDSGFYVVAFTDSEEIGFASGMVDLTVHITPNDGIAADLYAARVIIVFETALAQYAQLEREGA